MNNHQKRAGQYTRDLAEKRYQKRKWFALLTAGAAILLVILAFKSKAMGIGGIGFLGLILLARFIVEITEPRTRRMIKEERRAVRGAKGEEKIGMILENLDEDHLVIHDIESPYGNIDHIVINKQSGVFLIETKWHGGRVSIVDGRLLLNGHEPEKDFIAQVLKNTYWLRDEIRNAINVNIWITPILVFTNAFVEPSAPVKGVTIINKGYLLNVLNRSNRNANNLTVWENREKIQEILYD